MSYDSERLERLAGDELEQLEKLVMSIAKKTTRPSYDSLSRPRPMSALHQLLPKEGRKDAS